MPTEKGTQEQGATTKPQSEGQAGTQMKKKQQTDGQAQAPGGSTGRNQGSADRGFNWDEVEETESRQCSGPRQSRALTNTDAGANWRDRDRGYSQDQ
jgi:hypothetical protein